MDGSRCSEQTRFRRERRGKQLRAAEPGVQSRRTRSKQRGQAATVTPVHQPFDLPVREQRDFDQTHPHVIAHHRDLLAVEISAMDHHAGVREHERIVRAGIEFARDDLLDVPLRFLKRAEDLRRATQ